MAGWGIVFVEHYNHRPKHLLISSMKCALVFQTIIYDLDFKRPHRFVIWLTLILEIVDDKN